MRRIESKGIRRSSRPALRKVLPRSEGDATPPFRRVSLFEAVQGAVSVRLDELSGDGSSRTSHTVESDPVLDSLARIASGPFSQYKVDEGMAALRRASAMHPNLVGRLT